MTMTKLKYITTLFLFAMLPALQLFSQQDSIPLPTPANIPIDEASGLIVYQEVISEPGTKAVLFNRASEWLHQFFANPVHVTKVRDASSGIIKGRHQFELFRTDKNGNKIHAGMVLYSFKIEARDERYRYTVDELLLRQQSRFPIENWLDKNDPNYNPQWDEYLQQIDNYVKNVFAASLKEAMKPKKEYQEEEW